MCSLCCQWCRCVISRWCQGELQTPTFPESIPCRHAFLRQTALPWSFTKLSQMKHVHRCVCLYEKTQSRPESIIFWVWMNLTERVTPPWIALPYWSPLLVRTTCTAGFSPQVKDTSMSPTVTAGSIFLGAPLRCKAMALLTYSSNCRWIARFTAALCFLYHWEVKLSDIWQQPAWEGLMCRVGMFGMSEEATFLNSALSVLTK